MKEWAIWHSWTNEAWVKKSDRRYDDYDEKSTQIGGKRTDRLLSRGKHQIIFL